MAYFEYMKFIDYNGLEIELSENVWTEHIQVFHSELTLEVILKTLNDPDEVWVSQIRDNSVLYYLRKENISPHKNRYWMIAVKNTANKHLISSAMTKSTVVGSVCLYKRK